MNLALVVSIQILFLIVPFVVLYAVSLAKKKEYKAHRRIQNVLYLISLIAVLVLEVNIRMSGGSGSLVADSPYVQTAFFKGIFISHIIGAIITFTLWTISIIISNRRFNKRLPGNFSLNHKKIGYFIFFGLVFNAVSSLIVSTLAFFL